MARKPERLLMIMRPTAMLIALLLALGALLVLPAAAQEGGGQFCVQAFEDRNENGQLDAGEPLITRGIGANLLDSSGVIIATALLDNSPTAARGVICFLNLPVGQYTINITSADYEPTITDNMTVTISGDGLPTIFEYGARRIDTGPALTETSTAPSTEQALQRILIAALGGAVTMMLVGLIGLVLYLLFMRPRQPQPLPDGMMPPPDAYYMRPPDATPPPGMPPVEHPSAPESDEDTGQYRV
jgi:hypothetical protein